MAARCRSGGVLVEDVERSEDRVREELGQLGLVFLLEGPVHPDEATDSLKPLDGVCHALTHPDVGPGRVVHACVSEVDQRLNGLSALHAWAVLGQQVGAGHESPPGVHVGLDEDVERLGFAVEKTDRGITPGVHGHSPCLCP